LSESIGETMRMRMAFGVLEAAGANGFARQVNAYIKEPVAGEYTLLKSRSLPPFLNGRNLTIYLGDGESVSYAIMREPVSCNWMAAPSHLLRGAFLFDIYDLMWASAPFSTFEMQDDAVGTVLLEHGFLAPWITSRRAAYNALRLLTNADDSWLTQFLDPDEFGTYRCEGCDECGGGVDTIHRIPRELFEN